MFTTEKGIPIPVPRNQQGLTHTLKSMAAGDSVLIPGKTTLQMSGYIRYAKSGDGAGKKFTSRTVDGGCRIWRIA